MRADKRSFSFTWMRGQKGSSTANAQSDSGIINPQAMDFDMSHPNANDTASSSTWYLTNTSTSSSSSGVSSMSGSSLTSVGTDAGQRDLGSDNSNMTRSDSKNRLRRLGHSFTRFGTKYSIIEDDEENEPLNSKEPLTPATPSTSTQTINEPPQNAEPVHFDEDGNFIGRQGRSAQRRKPRVSSVNKDSGHSTTASLGKRLNKTVQEVKASIGHFSQKFRRSTRRRYRMGRGTPLSELTPTRKILGRTPTKLYSPFEIGFDSPAATKTPKRLERPSTPRRARRSAASGSGLLYNSPANNFRNDLADARQGMEDFHILSRDITRRSVRF